MEEYHHISAILSAIRTLRGGVERKVMTPRTCFNRPAHHWLEKTPQTLRRWLHLEPAVSPPRTKPVVELCPRPGLTTSLEVEFVGSMPDFFLEGRLVVAGFQGGGPGNTRCVTMGEVKQAPYRTVTRRLDEPKLEIGDTISIEEGLVGVVLARYMRSGDARNDVHYIVELRREAEKH